MLHLWLTDDDYDSIGERLAAEYDKLPKECREYIEFAEKAIGVPITMVSNGPSRNDIIYR